MHELLKKIAPEVEWTRCFPAVNKPAPKIGRPHAQPIDEHAGATGQRLVDEMLTQLRKHWRGSACNFDFVLLIDDADCRFAQAEDPSSAQAAWESRLAELVRDAVGKKELGFYSLLAWPEIEAWLVTDWDNGFAAQYRQVAPSLRQHVGGCILHPLAFSQIERFGGSLKNGTCEHKLSERIKDAFTGRSGCECKPPFVDRAAKDSAGAPLAYSKRIDGAAMLKRIEPERVAKDCPRFRSAYNRLRTAATKA
jgi:hypothetical protein